MLTENHSDELGKGQGELELPRRLRRLYFMSDKCFGVNHALLCVIVGRHLELMKMFPLYLPLSGRLEELRRSSHPAPGRADGICTGPSCHGESVGWL